MISPDFNQIATNLIEDSIKGAWKKVKGFFTDGHKKECIDNGVAFENYLRKTKDKNIKIKTLIYRREPVDLYSFYECVGVKCKGEIVETNTINNILEFGNKIIITGTGGIGKSILLKHLFLDSIMHTGYIPVLLELRSLNTLLEKDDFDLVKVLYENLINNGFDLEYEFYEYSLKNGAYIFLLDGYDELNRANAQLIAQSIKDMSDKYSNNKFIMSSRPSDEFIGWNDFLEMTACNLTKEQALSLIKKIKFDETIKEKFYKELDESLFEKYESFASNPLLLNIMLLTFESHAAVPDNLIDFYDNAFSALFNMHDATKDSYVRDIRSKLSCEEFKNILAHICLKTYFKNEFEFSEAKLNDYIKDALIKTGFSENLLSNYREDLVSSVCILVKDGLNYKFSHRSFQEYFAAWYMCKLTDEYQTTLFKAHLKKSFLSPSNIFLPILYNMQKDKFNKIFLCPYIEKIKKDYDNLGFSLDFFAKIFEGISLRDEDDGEQEKSSLAYVVNSNNRFYAEILFLTCSLNGYVKKHFDEQEDRLAQKLKKTFNQQSISFCINIEQLRSYLDEQEIMNNLEFLHDRLLFIFSILEKYENKSHSNKAEEILDLI